MRRPAPPDGIGDINCDGFVGDDDLLLLEQFIVGIIKPDYERYRRADTNGDGKLDALDITTLELYGNHVIDSFPASDPYHILGVDWSSSNDLIKKRYRELIKRLHPDTAAYKGDDTSFQFQMVQAAFEMIKRERELTPQHQ